VPQVAGFSTRRRIRVITSRQNASVQAFRDLARKRRPSDTRVLIDGWHLLIEARQAGLSIERAAFTTDLLNHPDTAHVAHELVDSDVDVIAVGNGVMTALSPVRTPSGVVAIGRCEDVAIGTVFARAPQLVLLAADVQDPGNLGAMVRAAEAAGATGVVACGASADPFGWKALRGSMGSAFRLPIARTSIDVALEAARAANVQVLAGVPHVGQPLFESDLRRPTAFLVGGEGSGLSVALVQRADGALSIPMRAPVESLNVAVAAALLLYEAARQRATLGSRL